MPVASGGSGPNLPTMVVEHISYPLKHLDHCAWHLQQTCSNTQAPRATGAPLLAPSAHRTGSGSVLGSWSCAWPVPLADRGARRGGRGQQCAAPSPAIPMAPCRS